MSKLIFLLLILIITVPCFALIPVEKAGFAKKQRYLEKGVFVGGVSSAYMTLLNVRHSRRHDKKTERLILDFNVLDQSQEVGRPNFFQVSSQKSPRRILIDIQNIVSSHVASQQVAELLKRSDFFSGAYFYFDKVKKDLTIELPLKNRAQIEVVEESKNRAIILDIEAP